MARNDDEKKILVLEREAAQLGYNVAEHSYQIGERELGDQFHQIADLLVMSGRMSAKTAAERRYGGTPGVRSHHKRVRQEIIERTKNLSEVVRAKYVQYHLAPFRCIDEHNECMRKQKRRKKSPYLCFVALFMCLGISMTALLAAIAAVGRIF